MFQMKLHKFSFVPQLVMYLLKYSAYSDCRWRFHFFAIWLILDHQLVIERFGQFDGWFFVFFFIFLRS